MGWCLDRTPGLCLAGDPWFYLGRISWEKGNGGKGVVTHVGSGWWCWHRVGRGRGHRARRHLAAAAAPTVPAPVPAVHSSAPPPAPVSPGLTVLMGVHRVLRRPEPPPLPPTTAMGCPQPPWPVPWYRQVSVRLGMACHLLTLPRVTATNVTSLLGPACAQLGVCPGLCVPVVHGDRV